MDLRQIQYFATLFEDGSVTRASKRLNIVQPALSMQISRLEEELQLRLFERGRQGMTPTAAGHRMYRLFTPILRDIANAREQLIRDGDQVTGHVSIGLIASITESVLSSCLSRFADRHPQVEVTVADGYSATLIDWVMGGQIDAAIINRPRGRLALDMKPLLDEEMVLVTGCGFGRELPRTIELARVAELDLVLTTKRHGLRGVIETHAQHEDVLLTPRFEIDSLSSLVSFVEATRYATILPRIAVQRGLHHGLLRAYPIVAPRIVRHVTLISHPRRPLSPAAQALMGLFAEEIQRVAHPADTENSAPAPTLEGDMQ